MYDQLCTFSNNLLLHIPVPFVLAQGKKITNKKVTNTAGVFLSPSDSLKPNCICGSYPEVYVHSGQPARWRLAVEAEVFVSFCVGSDNKSLKALLCILKCGQVSTAPQTLVVCQTCCGRE